MIQPHEIPRLRSLAAVIESSYRSILRHDAREKDYRQRLADAKTELTSVVASLDITKDDQIMRWALVRDRIALLQEWLGARDSVRSSLSRALEAEFVFLRTVAQNNNLDHTAYGQWHAMDVRIDASVKAANELVSLLPQ
jgi:hypothetical protein